jgi:hypothetical protein
MQRTRRRARKSKQKARRSIGGFMPQSRKRPRQLALHAVVNAAT